MGTPVLFIDLVADSEVTAPEAPLQKVETGHLVRSVLLAWLVPGFGHLALGKKTRAVVFSVLIFASIGIGLSLDGNLHRIVPDRPLTILATLASMGSGLPYFLLRYILGYAGELTAPGYEYGSAFLLTAGLMNLLLVLDCWDIALGRKD